MNEQDIFNKDKYYINPETREIVKKFDPQDLQTWINANKLAFISFCIEIIGDVLFFVGCLFYLVQIIISTSATHNDNKAMQEAYINDTKNFWPVILGGVLFGLGIAFKATKFFIQLKLVPLVKKLIAYAPYDSLNYTLKKYDTWKISTAAFLNSFNLIIGFNTDKWVINFCKKHKTDIQTALKTNSL